MPFTKQYWVWIISTLILWVLFSLLFTSSEIGNVAYFRNFLFSFLIIATLLFIHKKLIPKLSVFSIAGQIFLKTVLYIVSVLGVSSMIFVVFAFYSLSKDLVIGEIIVHFAKAVTLLFLSPFSEISTADIIPQKVEYMFYTVIFLFSFIGLASVLVSYIQIHWAHERGAAQINEARVKMFQAQIQPHFLFNTLNTIVSIVRENPAKAEELLLQFSDFYRFSFSTGDNKTIQLKDEIRFIDNYLNLLKARFGDYLHWSIELEDSCETVEIPVMILQPVVENAIKHGWQEKKQNFNVSLLGSKKESGFEITIKDDGSGFHLDKEKTFPPKGHGLYAIQQRLNLFYNQKNLIRFDSNLGQGTTITINLPE